jgi:aminoglycoside phosphotransferase (APT) family kinase protein
MLASLRQRPWRAPGEAQTLAHLHSQLHEIRFEDNRLMHLDLHPGNVLVSHRGPIVIDWTNARTGNPALDVALTWVICATSAGAGGRAFTNIFLRYVERDAARQALPDAVGRRARRCPTPSRSDSPIRR